MKNRSLSIAVAGMGLLAAGALQAAGLGACPRLDMGARAQDHAGGAFTWTTTASPASPAYVPGLRIAVWGDSLTSSRDFIGAALDTAGIARGAAVPSLIQAGIPVPGLQLPVKAACASPGWRVGYAHKEKRSQPGFSKGFLSMTADSPGETIALDLRPSASSTRVKAVTVLYEKPAPDASLLLAVSVDGGAEEYVSLTHKSGPVLRIVPEVPLATVKLRVVSGKITVHGFAPVYDSAPALLLDAFSVPGGLLRSWSNTAAAYFAAAPEVAVDYNLVLVQYGTNEGAAPSFSRTNYLGYLRENLGRMRSFYPRARCVLIGPPDRGVVGSGGGLKYANVHAQIAAAQKQVGLEHGCAFWDWQAAMGGPGSAARWAAMQPPQMQRDLTHLTAKGYQLSGRMFAQALLLNRN